MYRLESCEKMSRMFPFVTESQFSPLGGECHHNCYGNRCWAKNLSNQYKMKKYQGPPRLYERQLKRKFTKDDFVFVNDMNDLFGDWVPASLIEPVVQYANNSPAQFLFLTKNPKRYKVFTFGSNCVLGATIESDIEINLGGAPHRDTRLTEMEQLQHSRKMLSIEPIMAFTPDFRRRILLTNPEFVAIGYDNYGLKLVEPWLETTELLIAELEAKGIKVYRKTIREKWDA